MESARAHTPCAPLEKGNALVAYVLVVMGKKKTKETSIINQTMAQIEKQRSPGYPAK